MTSEIQRIAPLRAANITSILYGVLMSGMALVMLVVISSVPSGDVQGDSADAIATARWFLLLYPVFGFGGGWLTGLLGAAAYNFLQRFTGGFLIELEASPTA